MTTQPLLTRWLLAIISAAIITFPKFVAFASITSLDEAILTDILTKYSTYEDSDARCTSSVATDITFDWPGTDPNSEWYQPFEQYERELFQAQMSFADGTGGNRSWRIRM